MSSLHIVLVEPEIPWNTGSIGRNALAVNARLHLVKPLGFSLDAQAVRRAGLDYWKNVDLKVWESWEEFECELPQLGTPYFFAASGRKVYWDVEYAENAVLVFGRESVGLSEKILTAYAQQTVNIPMAKEACVRSYNLAAVVMAGTCEVHRQRFLRGEKSL